MEPPKTKNFFKDAGDASSESDGEAGQEAGEGNQEEEKPLDPFQTFASKEKQDEFLGSLMVSSRLLIFFPRLSDVWVLVLNASRPPPRLKKFGIVVSTSSAFFGSVGVGHGVSGFNSELVEI